MEKWLSSHNKENSPAVLLGDFNMPFIAPSERKMKALLSHVFFFGLIKMKWFFGINKCVTMVIKPLSFVSYPGYEEPTFHLVMYSICKVSVCIYLGISFSNDLSLEPIITYMNTKVRKSLFSFSSFFYPIIKFH